MRKLGYILSPLFVFGIALTASAQKVDTHQDRGETLKVTVTGDIDFHYVYRNDDLNRAGAGSGTDATGHSTNQFEGSIGLRLDIELSEKINAVVSLRTQRVDGTFVAGDGNGGSDSAGSIGAAIGADQNRYGANPEELNLFVDEASVTLNELFNPGLKLTAGIVPVSFDIRGRGSSFFFDPRHSSTFGKNLAAAINGGTVVGFSDELQPAGAHLVYSKDAISLGLFLLPAIIEGGPQTDDEAAYGIWFMYSLESVGKGSRIGATVTWNQLSGASLTGAIGNNNNIFTIGAGTTLQGLVEGLEVYLEIYFQFGTVGQVGDDDIDARGFALQLGGEYRLPNNENNIWFALNFKYVSGDDDNTDDRFAGFLSYENINDTLILEDQYFGIDLDTNYWTIQGSVGAAFTVGSGALKNNLEVSLLFAFCKLAQDVLDVNGNDTDDIGHELDLKVKIWASKQVSFDTAFAVLFGSDVLESVIGNEADEDDRVGFLWTVGTNLRY